MQVECYFWAPMWDRFIVLGTVHFTGVTGNSSLEQTTGDLLTPNPFLSSAKEASYYISCGKLKTQNSPAWLLKSFKNLTLTLLFQFLSHYTPPLHTIVRLSCSLPMIRTCSFPSPCSIAITLNVLSLSLAYSFAVILHIPFWDLSSSWISLPLLLVYSTHLKT